MSTLSLRISLEGGRVTKTIQFHPNTTVFDACKIIRDKFAEAVRGQGKWYFICIFFFENIRAENYYFFSIATYFLSI